MIRNLRHLTTEYVKYSGKNGITATIIADSINEKGNRMTTYELEYPRFIHAEFMTHRILSKNAASSRAIPVSKMIDNIVNSTAVPIHWGKNRKGMQATEENDELIPVKINGQLFKVDRQTAWLLSRDSAIDFAQAFADAGYHKQIVNRIIEPYKMIKVVCSGTEFDNFFWLRRHTDAQQEIRELADTMYRAYCRNEPYTLFDGEYHLPYITPKVYEKCIEYSENYNKKNREKYNPQSLAIKVSASCCAQVSYRSTDTGIDKALKIYKQLIESKPIHASPFEHQARPYSKSDVSLFLIKANKCGITHISKNSSYWSGNLRGWIQYRHEIPNNTCWNYDPYDRYDK